MKCMINNRYCFGAVFAICAAAILSGCTASTASKKIEIVPKSFVSSTRPLTFKEILLVVNAQWQQIDSVKADVRVEIKSDVLTNVQYCSAKLIVARPDKIRLKGFQPFVPTLFDMASNGKQYWLYFPQDKKVYTGDYYRNDVWSPSPLDIDPAQLAQAFLIDGIAEGQTGQVVFSEREGENDYIVYQLDGWQNRYYLKRKIWVDALQKRVTRQQYFINDGNIAFEVQYDKYLADKRNAMPQQIIFFRAAGNSRAIVEIVHYEFNRSLSPDLFELSDIHGAQTVTSQ